MTALPDWMDLPDGMSVADRSLSVFCYRLDPTTGTYASAGIHTGKMTVTDPVSITIDLTTLL
jgi:hypothetical protein